MDRKAREDKAALVRRAISAIRHDLRAAKDGTRRAELMGDLGMAMTDYDTLMDDGAWDEAGSYMGYMGSPMDEPEVAPMDAWMGEEPEGMGDWMEEPMDQMTMRMGDPGHGAGCQCPQCMHMSSDNDVTDDNVATAGNAIEAMEESEPNDDTKAPGGEVPMGAMAEHSNAYASVEQANRQHISYILDKTADVTKAIEDYEHQAVVAGKTPKSATARARIASVMKELAHVVSKADLKKEAAGTRLDVVGCKVMKLHTHFGLNA